MTNQTIINPEVRHQLAAFLWSEHNCLVRSIASFTAIDQPSSVTDVWIERIHNNYRWIYFGARCMARRCGRLELLEKIP